MKKLPSRAHARKHKRRKRDTDQLAAQLAPLEEQNKQTTEHIVKHIEATNGQQQQDYGAIVVDNGNLNVPRDIIEGGEEKQFLGMEPVVLIVFIIVLGFIAFIAWQISLMPAG